MRLIAGALLGLVGYAAWSLSEPRPGEPSDFSSRLDRLRTEWNQALSEGKIAGEARRAQMQAEFEAIFKHS